MKFSIQANGNATEADVQINDFIGDWLDDYWGFGVTSRAFIDELNNLPDAVKTVRVHVNSPGGDVVAANHIANTIRDQQTRGRTFEILVEGAAWSAATIVTSAGKPTKIADNALMMIHDPWAIALGNARDLRAEADVLDKFRDTIVAAYQWKSPLSTEKLAEMMAESTWMDPDEAVANGFADEKIAGAVAAAAFDITKFPKQMPSVPVKYAARAQALLKCAKDGRPAAIPAPNPAAERNGAQETERALAIINICSKAGVPEMSASFIAQGATVEAVKARLADADNIRARCISAKLPERANLYIIAGMTPDEVSENLFAVMVASQSPEISTALTTDRVFGVIDGRIDYKAIFENYTGASKPRENGRGRRW